MNDLNQVSCISYTLLTKSGGWLGQIVLTSDGMFSGVTDYGNLSYAWRAHGCRNFRDFIRDISVEYFATKLSTGMAYIAHSKKIDSACLRFAEKILPALQEAIKEEIEAEKIVHS